MSFKNFPLASPPPQIPIYITSRLWEVHQVNKEPTDQLPAMNNHRSWVCSQSQSSLFSQGVPDPGYLQPYRIAISAHKSITLLYFLGSIKTNLSTQTHGVTMCFLILTQISNGEEIWSRAIKNPLLSFVTPERRVLGASVILFSSQAQQSSNTVSRNEVIGFVDGWKIADNICSAVWVSPSLADHGLWKGRASWTSHPRLQLLLPVINQILKHIAFSSLDFSFFYLSPVLSVQKWHFIS